MEKRVLRFALLVLSLTLVGCQSSVTSVTIDPTSIPDQTYEVTVYWSHPRHYAVLFDIPDDGIEVAMFYTDKVERVGRDTPGKYIDRFKTRIKSYYTKAISSQDGPVRGYLMISHEIGYLAYGSPPGERILVLIVDPRERRSTR